MSPIDTGKSEAQLRLQAYVWADQELRLARLRGALNLAADNPPEVEALTASDFVRAKLDKRRGGEAFVLFHSIMWQYMPSVEHDEIISMMESAGAAATVASPICWLRMEPNDTGSAYAPLKLTIWPDAGAGTATRDLARCDYHGRWIEWIDGASL